MAENGATTSWGAGGIAGVPGVLQYQTVESVVVEPKVRVRGIVNVATGAFVIGVELGFVSISQYQKGAWLGIDLQLYAIWFAQYIGRYMFLGLFPGVFFGVGLRRMLRWGEGRREVRRLAGAMAFVIGAAIPWINALAIMKMSEPLAISPRLIGLTTVGMLSVLPFLAGMLLTRRRRIDL